MNVKLKKKYKKFMRGRVIAVTKDLAHELIADGFATVTDMVPNDEAPPIHVSEEIKQTFSRSVTDEEE